MILEIMKDMFTNKVGMQQQFVVDPLTYRMHLFFRNSFSPEKDDFKYKFLINIDKIKVNLSKETI